MISMESEKQLFTNVSIRTFASDVDAALFDKRWNSVGPTYLKRLGEKGLLSYETAKIWNKETSLMSFVVFRYGSAKAVKNCLPIWEKIEKTLFPDINIKMTACRGVTIEYWEAE